MAQPAWTKAPTENRLELKLLDTCGPFSLSSFSCSAREPANSSCNFGLLVFVFVFVFVFWLAVLSPPRVFWFDEVLLDRLVWPVPVPVRRTKGSSTKAEETITPANFSLNLMMHLPSETEAIAIKQNSPIPDLRRSTNNGLNVQFHFGKGSKQHD